MAKTRSPWGLFPSRTRSPLSNRSNAVGLPTTTTRWDRKDSSEGQPSQHDSICDAAYVTASDSDAAKSPYYQPTARPSTPVSPLSLSPTLDIDIAACESPLSRLESQTQTHAQDQTEPQTSPFLYGHGTELAPIAEQRSLATLRTGSLSTSDLSSLMHGAPGIKTSKAHSVTITRVNSPDPEAETNNTPTTPRKPHRLRRQQSFSLDDLPTIRPPTRGPEPRPRLCTPAHAHDHPTVHVLDVHTYPQKPIYPAHQAARTPSTVAAWMDRVDGGGGHGTHHTTTIPTFRPPRSGHASNLDRHPFMKLPPQPDDDDDDDDAWEDIPGTHGARRRRGPNPTPGPERDRQSGGERLRQAQAARRLAKSKLCKTCHRPAYEPRSLRASLLGVGQGVRRKEDWCGRCAWRRVAQLSCCGSRTTVA
ncbi:hypothetical protein F5Y15DRAFT_178703 [Xylariaceae sp. FL0016]|nr:hypothetical protein F5Y15DRAFT_178703 [Xylariaceae sp. FL0016]